jgi:hypothetical protein
MGVGVAKIDKQSIPQQLGDMSIKACDDLGADLLIRTDDFPILFGIELRREFRGVHQITKHNGELPTFRVGRRRDSRAGYNKWGMLFLSSRWLCRLSGLRGNCLCADRVASPHETSSFVIADWVHIEDFFLQVLDIVVINTKASLDGTIRDPSLAFEEVNELGENVIEGHR